MTPEIIRKLSKELTTGITTEVQVVYLLAGIRKLIERDKLDVEYARLKFHCDWALHSHLDRAAAKAILRQFDAAHALLRDGLEFESLPRGLEIEIDRISKMEYFEQELSEILAVYSMPPLTLHSPDGWTYFLHLYAKVIEDIPLVIPAKQKQSPQPQTPPKPGPTYISRVTVNCEMARESMKHGDREEMLFKVTWTIQDKNGKSGIRSIFNSFELRPSKVSSAEALAKAGQPILTTT